MSGKGARAQGQEVRKGTVSLDESNGKELNPMEDESVHQEREDQGNRAIIMNRRDEVIAQQHILQITMGDQL